ncbi:MAG: acyl CoA:acetate/3-ketoacid CoA transferase [Clostridiales bacterium]|nr:acyl CoA:acetate/3-ketoacid CoA transferase [Clostridiales bacterium]
MKNKVKTVKEAIRLIKDGDCIAVTAAGLIGYPEYIVRMLEEKFLSEGHPNRLTLYSGCGHGVPMKNLGDGHFAHSGFLKKVVCSHPDVVPSVRDMIERNEIEAYVLPQGILNQLYRSSAARQPGILSKIGMGTYIDPRQDGGKMNRVTTRDIVRVMELDGEEWLFYESQPVTVAIVRGTTADENGNISIEKEALRLEILEAALAAKASGGIVIVQVERLAAAHSIPAKQVVIPGEIVDAVVVADDVAKDHRQTDGTLYSPYKSGELRAPFGVAAESAVELTPADIICRRAVFELQKGAIVNVGVGVGAGVGRAAAVENMADQMTFTLELGAIGGTPQQGSDFGSSVNPDSFLAHPSMFDFYHGGNLDITFLGAAQIDAEGNVNVSRFGGRPAGQGGFIDISQSSKKIVFCTYFKTKGFRAVVDAKGIHITKEGTIPKFVSGVEQITFNGDFARRRKQEVIIVTEHCVFQLGDKGMMLTELAPGIDLERDILGQMEFKPLISPDLKRMDSRIFKVGRMGCFDTPDAFGE